MGIAGIDVSQERSTTGVDANSLGTPGRIVS